MTYVMTAIGDGDSSMVGQVRDVTTPMMTAAGASSIRAAVIQTGPNTGKGFIDTEWATPDDYFGSRANWLGDPEVQKTFQAAGITSNQVMMAEVTGVRGTCEGKYGVALLQSATDSSQGPLDRLLDAVEGVMIGKGANGLRATRILTGDNTGLAMGVFFVDSLAGYFSNLQDLLADEKVVAGFTEKGLVTHRRTIAQFV